MVEYCGKTRNIRKAAYTLEEVQTYLPRWKADPAHAGKTFTPYLCPVCNKYHIKHSRLNPLRVSRKPASTPIKEFSLGVIPPDWD